MGRKQTNYIVVHCSATTPEMDHVDVDWIRNLHVKHNGWSDIGYHWVIKRDGAIQAGRPVDEIGAHTKGHNYESVGICMVGGISAVGRAENNFTKAQFDALRDILEEMLERYPDAKILGHRDLSPDKDGDGVVEPHEWLKMCPSFDVREWLLTGEEQ